MRQIFRNLLLGVMLLTCAFPALSQQRTEQLSGDLILFHAGSLAAPMREMTAQFNRLHPDVRILSESAGSITCARKISELGRSCDVMASADFSVIDELLIPDHAAWYLTFAENEMVITYTDKSRLVNEINADNWYRILMDDRIIFGRSDPNTDPCGYRAVFVMQLAERYYSNLGLAEKMLDKDVRFIRPKEVDMLALLDSGDLDYAFLYRSVAEQHGLKYVVLPEEINLSDSRLENTYSEATIQISGASPGTFLTKTGAPIVYGVTIPFNAPNPDVAIEFIRFIYDQNGGIPIMDDCGFIPIYRAATNDLSTVPTKLQPFAEREE